MEEEFPLEEDIGDTENETKEAASMRLEMAIEERFFTDENNLALVMVQKHKTQ